MNPLAADIQYCSDGIRPGEEVLVESSDGRLIAIGKAITSSRIIRELKTGAVIKIRKVKKR
jgi:Prefoldin, molecular chaperone implicated in de novo protein folding, alpha subunit